MYKTMKKVYISPKSKLLSLEPETMIAGSAENPPINNSDAVVDGGGSVIMEGREVIRTQSAWDNEW